MMLPEEYGEDEPTDYTVMSHMIALGSREPPQWQMLGEFIDDRGKAKDWHVGPKFQDDVQIIRTPLPLLGIQ